MACKDAGKTIVLSSHNMNEVEKLCDRIGIIHKGRLVATGSIPQLLEEHGGSSLEEVFMKLVGDRNEF